MVMAFIFVACSGCVFDRYKQSRETVNLTRLALGNKTGLSSLTITNSNGSVSLKGYRNDQVEALGAVTEAAVSAAIKAK